jgi:hypothetical protein
VTRACRSGHDHADAIDVMICQQDHIIDLLRGLTLMTEATGETMDQGFADLEAGQADIEKKIDALTAEEARELAHLAELEHNRGIGQLEPNRQHRLEDLKARQAAVAAVLDKAREELAVADGTEPAPEPMSPNQGPTGGGDGLPTSGTDAPVGEPVPVDDMAAEDDTAAMDTPIADSIQMSGGEVAAPGGTRVITSADLVSTDEAGNPVLTNVQTGDGNATGVAPAPADDEPVPNES